jgi:hypothetical protein
MKIKADFVTNSSSANFYLYLEMTEDFTLDSFFDLFGAYMENLMRVYSYRNDFKNMRFFQPTIIVLNDRNFKLEDSTSMLNDYDNVPYYMKHIVMEHINVRPDMSDFFLIKLKSVKFESISTQ